MAVAACFALIFAVIEAAGYRKRRDRASAGLNKNIKK